MVFTDEEGNGVDVNCLAAWSFFASLIASAKFCGPFS